MQEADAVVIGAGAFGTATAYHLVRGGLARVVLLDKHEPASQNSRRAAGLTAQARGTDAMTRLAMRSIYAIGRFAEEVGEPLTFERSGSLKVARLPEHEEQLRGEVARGRRLGLEIDLISPAEAKRLAPFLEPVGIRAISYTPSDIYLEPAQLPLGYARAAVRLGATLLPRTAVTGIAVDGGGRVGSVLTDRGKIATPIVVDAAGAWARQVGGLAGARLPLVPTRHQLLISRPIAGVTAEMPIVRVIDGNVYLRPAGGGLLLGGYEPDPIQYDMRNLPSDFQIQDLPLDLGPLRRLAADVGDQLPVLRDLAVREHRGGLPTMTPDGRQVVGPIPGVAGLFVAGGCCVGGLSISPAVGEGLAEWILSGRPPRDLDWLAADRFGAASWSEERLRSDCRRQYANRYASH